jgi:hypothetical protein
LWPHDSSSDHARHGGSIVALTTSFITLPVFILIAMATFLARRAVAAAG